MEDDASTSFVEGSSPPGNRRLPTASSRRSMDFLNDGSVTSELPFSYGEDDYEAE